MFVHSTRHYVMSNKIVKDIMIVFVNWVLRSMILLSPIMPLSLRAQVAGLDLSSSSERGKGRFRGQLAPCNKDMVPAIHILQFIDPHYHIHCVLICSPSPTGRYIPPHLRGSRDGGRDSDYGGPPSGSGGHYGESLLCSFFTYLRCCVLGRSTPSQQVSRAVQSHGS